MFESGQLRLVLLKLLDDEPRHGYDLIRAIEELTGGGYTPSPGIVYPTLSLLQDSGDIEELEAEGARKAFAITDQGRAELEEKKGEVATLFERLSSFGERHRKSDGAPIRRAMGNLGAVLEHRLSREGVEDELVHQVTAIIDEAAQKIERL
ncbi:PadR family transcriptional regulator [Parasphingopyxis marina]|nr:PadR family transcriptional regulator [Parasphingopyxis marina]